MPPPVPCVLPCNVAACLSSPLPCLSTFERPYRRQHPCRTRQFAPAARCRRTLLCLLLTPASLPHARASIMVHTRGAHIYRPRVQFSTLEREGDGTSKAATAHSPAQVIETPPPLAPTTAIIQGPSSAFISEEAQASEPPSRRYQTRVGPRPPSPVNPRPRRRAPPSK